MNKRQSKFESNKILQKEIISLVADKLIKNMNFVKVDSNKEDERRRRNDWERQEGSQLNASDVMGNVEKRGRSSSRQQGKSLFGAGNHSRNSFAPGMNSSNVMNSQNLKASLRSRSSQRIATDFQNSMLSKKDSSFYDTLMNSSNEMAGYRSSKLGRSLLDVSQNRSRQGVSKERKTEESVLRYEDYIKEKPLESNKRNVGAGINFSYADESDHVYTGNTRNTRSNSNYFNRGNKNTTAIRKTQLIEEFLSKNLGTKVKLEEATLNSTLSQNKNKKNKQDQHSEFLERSLNVNSSIQKTPHMNRSTNIIGTRKNSNAQEGYKSNKVENRKKTKIQEKEVKDMNDIKELLEAKVKNTPKINKIINENKISTKTKKTNKITNTEINNKRFSNSIVDDRKGSKMNNVNIFALKIKDDKITKVAEKGIDRDRDRVIPSNMIQSNNEDAVMIINTEDPFIHVDQVNYATNPSFKEDNLSEILPSRESIINSNTNNVIKPNERKSSFYTNVKENTIPHTESNKITHDDDDCCDVDEFDEKDKNQQTNLQNLNKVYKTGAKVKMEEMNLNDTVVKEEVGASLRQYDELLNKYLFSNPLNTLNDSNSNMSFNNNLNDSHISKSDLLEKDLESVLSAKKSRKKFKLYYQKEIKKLEKELKDLEDIKNAEFDKIRERKEKEILALKEKLSGDKKDKTESKIRIIAELETLKSNLQMKENNYKNTIKSLLSELKNSNSASNIGVSHISAGNLAAELSNNSEIVELNNLNEYDSILKEINDVLEDSVVDEGFRNTTLQNSLCGVSSEGKINPDKFDKNNGHNNKKAKSLTNNQNPNLTSQNVNNSTTLNTKSKIENKIDHFDDDSMMAELEEFKLDDLSHYTFEIPLKYQLSKNAKIESEDKKNDGKVVRYYDNAVVEIISKNKNITRLFPDGYSVTFYANKDIKQAFPKGKVLYYYSKNKSMEFNIPTEGFIAYKFKNNQFEKHFFDGRKYIKFADGSIKIFRPNGEELNEFIDKTVQRKDKLGNISTKKK